MFATRFAPNSFLSEMNRLQKEMDRVFGPVWEQSRSQAVFPPVNIWGDDEAIFVEAELPGFQLDELEITVTAENQLSLKGQRSKPELEGATWHRQERAYGSFNRLLDLPEQVDVDRVIAEFKHGVLTVTLPKSEKVKPRKIAIKAD